MYDLWLPPSINTYTGSDLLPSAVEAWALAVWNNIYGLLFTLVVVVVLVMGVSFLGGLLVSDATSWFCALLSGVYKLIDDDTYYIFDTFSY